MGDTKDESQKNGSNASGSNKTLIILGIVAVVIIIALVAVIAVLVLGKKNDEPTAPAASQPEPESKREVLVTEDNVQEVLEQMDEIEYTPPGRYTATMNFEWHFATGDSESYDSYVGNDPGNTNDVYFDIFLADDDENAIYESPIIPIGSEIRNIRLKTDLDAGTYDCILVYHLVDENQNSLGTVSFALKIIIEG